jgi:hypothetical protein
MMRDRAVGLLRRLHPEHLTHLAALLQIHPEDHPEELLKLRQLLQRRRDVFPRALRRVRQIDEQPALARVQTRRDSREELLPDRSHVREHRPVH